MQQLSKDVKREIALDLSPPDLINLCSTQKEFNKEICESRDFWMRKLEKDYPEEFLQFHKKGIPVKNPKDRYIKKFTFISRQIESFIDEFIDKVFGYGFLKFLNEDYKKGLYKVIYDVYSEAKKDKEKDIEELLNEAIDVYLFQDYNAVETTPVEMIEDFISFLLVYETQTRIERKEVERLKKK